MLPERYRRLWRRRLRRRPLLPFLLLATLAVDAVLWVGARGDNPVVTGLVAGQLALLGAWVTWAPRGVTPRAVVALAATLLALALTGTLALGERADRVQATPYHDVDLPGLATAVILASLAATTLGAAAVRLLQRLRRGLRAPLRTRVGIAALLWATAFAAAALAFGRTAQWDVLTAGLVAVLVVVEAAVTTFTLALLVFSPNRIVSWLRVAAVPLCLLAAAAMQYEGRAHLMTYHATQIAFFGSWLLALGPQASRTERPAAPRDQPESIDAHA